MSCNIQFSGMSPQLWCHGLQGVGLKLKIVLLERNQQTDKGTSSLSSQTKTTSRETHGACASVEVLQTAYFTDTPVINLLYKYVVPYCTSKALIVFSDNLCFSPF